MPKKKKNWRNYEGEACTIENTLETVFCFTMFVYLLFTIYFYFSFSQSADWSSVDAVLEREMNMHTYPGIVLQNDAFDFSLLYSVAATFNSRSIRPLYRIILCLSYWVEYSRLDLFN